MKWNSYLAIAGVVASLAAVPAALEAQDGEHMRGSGTARTAGPGRMMAGPAERLLAQRSELNLSADQVARLERIRDTYAEREKPYMEEMRKLRAERQEARPREDREARRERPAPSPAARAAMDSLRASREAARREAFGVLTDDQRAKVEERMKERRESRPRMRRGADSAGVRGA